MNFKLYTHKYVSALETEKKSLLAKLEASENEVTNLKNMSKDVMEQQAEYNNNITTLKAQYDKSHAEQQASYENEIAEIKSAHEKEIAELKAATDKEISELKAKVELEAKSSEVKAANTLAKIGVPADELPKATNAPLTAEDIMAKFNTLSGVAQSNFYQANKEVILSKLGMKT